MTRVQKTRAKVKNGKIIEKNEVGKPFYIMDSIAEHMVYKQKLELANTKKHKDTSIFIDYIVVLEADVVTKDGVKVSDGDVIDQEEDKSPELKKKSPGRKPRAKRPGE